MKDLYAVLGIPKTATKEEITKAYRKGAKTHHPDVNPGDADAARRFGEIQEAYDILSDPNKRAEYDRGPTMHFRRGNASPFSGFDPFAEMAADFFHKSNFRGRNLQVRLELDLYEVYTGCKKQIFLKIKNKCNTCKGQGQTSSENCSHCNGEGFVKVNNAPFEFRTNCTFCNGSGKVNPKPCSDCSGKGTIPGYKEKKIEIEIPCGIDNGMQVRVHGEGEESQKGGNPGDVIVFIIVKDHPIFTRQGIDLFVDVPVSYTQLALGSDVEIPTLSGDKILLKIPAGTQSHSKFKINAKGLPAPQGVIGDMFVTVKVETPKELTDEYKNALEILRTLEDSQIGPKRTLWQKNAASVNK
jgi:molecular chaperone DnaJ